MSRHDLSFSVKPSTKFKNIKAKLIRQGKLYEDPEFPAGPEALGPPPDKMPSNYYWKRPWEIKNDPKFVIDGMKISDIYQGELGTCWLLAAVGCLVSVDNNLIKRCIPENQDFDEDYAGVFCFNFWQFGKWVEVIIDDRLPTNKVELVFTSNQTDRNEFWAPLLEKAYAKLYNGYYNIHGGFLTNAMVDLTGGISETIQLEEKWEQKDSFYDELFEMIAKSCIFGASVINNLQREQELENGLISGHAYSIKNFVMLNWGTKRVNLLHLKNPWGRHEWNGAWSDGSPEWNNVPEKEKKILAYVIKNDGEFWMSFDDFIRSFHLLSICHLNPTEVVATESKENKLWKSETIFNRWTEGISDGGLENLWINPQYLVSVDLSSKESIMIITLMQESQTKDHDVGIDFKVYKLKDKNLAIKLNASNVKRKAEKARHRNSEFSIHREVSDHIRISPGKYVIIPHTLNRNIDKNFLLRIFTESDIESQIVEIQPNSDDVDKNRSSFLPVYKKCCCFSASMGEEMN